MTTTQLSQTNLNELPVQGPEFDRSRVTAGVVHFGVGGFHRAHQALYIDKLMRQGEAMDFGIIGMDVMPSDIRMRDALKSQDFLYTLTEKKIGRASCRERGERDGVNGAEKTQRGGTERIQSRRTT